MPSDGVPQDTPISENNPLISQHPNMEPVRDSAQKRISLQRVPVGSRASSSFSSPQPNGGGIWTPSPVASPEQMHDPQFSGITRAPNSNSLGPDGLKESVSRAWDRGTESGMYEPLRDDSNSGNTSGGGIGLNRMEGPANQDDLQRNADAQHHHDEEDVDEEDLSKQYNQPFQPCSSRHDVHLHRWSWISITILALSVYSTVLSGVWLVTAIVQPRWGRKISSTGNLMPSTASLLTALLAKTIELSFVTVFVALIGQVLTRRAISRKSKGMTLSEATMRNWIMQPGSLITNGETLHYSALTVLGALTLTATIVAMFYTTASDAMVAPKLKFGGWSHKQLQNYVRSSYANPYFVRDSCATPISTSATATISDSEAGAACLDVQYSGNSYHNLLAFMSTWHDININGTSLVKDMTGRPQGIASLYDNITLTSAWIEAENSNVTKNAEKFGGRIINNVTLAMPHPGVYAAATNEVNNIIQPTELGGVGEYAIRASVVSPTVNTMCVNLSPDELAPLVYTAWPHADVDNTTIPGQHIGNAAWQDDVPAPSDTEWLNKTVVDDVFRWGEAFQRRPPVFQLYPIDSNIITNTSVANSDAIYLLGKNRLMPNYTLCELRSWTTSKCSTRFNISGTTGAHMSAWCEDPYDPDVYSRSFQDINIETSKDWRNLADQWRLSIDLNGGVANNNASNARILTQLALQTPELPNLLPSMAEALAVLASSTLITGSIDTPLRHYWSYPSTTLEAPGILEPFNVSIVTQEYTSSHTSEWQSIFYIVLALVFAMNCFCLVYFIIRSGLVTDFTEPANLFALAVNSPPSEQLKGSCGGGPKRRDLVVPYRVAYATGSNHFYFEEARDKPWRGKYRHSLASAMDLEEKKPSKYNRLSTSKVWL